MKPKDLKIPYSWDKRHIVLKDQVLFIPELIEDYSDFHFPSWESPLIFGNNCPTNIEYCSGNGHWIAAKALENRDQNWVAVEKNFERVRRIWSKKINHNLSNLLIVYGEGVKFTSHFVQSHSIRAVYVNFPDPWPKRRHWKHRIIQSPFLKEMTRVMKEGGDLFLVTDDPAYSSAIIEEITAFPQFKSHFDKPYYKEDLWGYGSSYFEELWRSQGKAIRYHQFLLRKASQ